jgi:hypothetical protein
MEKDKIHSRILGMVLAIVTVGLVAGGGLTFANQADSSPATICATGDRGLASGASREVQLSDCITILFQWDFESGWDDWWADNGVWEIGAPTAGPDGPHGGSQCAGTNLDGNYPAYIDSRLISAPVTLPEVSGDEQVHLRFWQWFSYANDEGRVQVSVYSDGEWGSWESVGYPIQYSVPYWSMLERDLTEYAGEKIRIAFYHIADSVQEATGWYIDDVAVQLDLVITEIKCDRENDRVGYVVQNMGDGVALAGHWTTLWVSDIEMCHDEVGIGLDSGESYEGWFDCYEWPAYETIEVTVCADNYDAVEESNEDNNCRECVLGVCGDVAPYACCDGIVNMGDVVLLLNYVGHPGEYKLCCDWCGDVAPCPASDGVVNMGDVVLLLGCVGYPGEYDLCCG